MICSSRALVLISMKNSNCNSAVLTRGIFYYTYYSIIHHSSYSGSIQSKNPVSAVCVNNMSLFLALRGGQVLQLSVPDLTVEFVYKSTEQIVTEEANTLIEKLFVNADSSRLGILDNTNFMRLLCLHQKIQPSSPQQQQQQSQTQQSITQPGELVDGVECEDVWDMLWADDNCEMFCLMEKCRLTVFRGQVAEESIPCSGYLCSFNDLRVKLAMMDELMAEPERPQPTQILVAESQTLRKVRRKCASYNTY